MLCLEPDPSDDFGEGNQDALVARLGNLGGSSRWLCVMQRSNMVEARC